jgi:Tfp pilus assembly protein PilN
MPYQPGQGKTAVALFVDGLELKFVQLSTKKGRVTLRDYKTVALIQKFEEKPGASAEGGIETPEMGAESFGEPTVPSEMTEQEGQNNAAVLLSILTDLPSSKYTVSYALSEPAVTYQEFESDSGLKGTKLKKHVAQELSAMRSAAPALDALDFIPTAQGGLLSIVREDGMHLYDLLREIKPFIGNRIPKVNLIDSADTALIGLVRSSYELQEEEVTVLVYVGNDFSRLVFMQGKNYLHFAPIISEGYGSSNIENTIYSRILLEQDNIALTRIDRIILCGESHKVSLRESLAPQFTSATVEYLQTTELDLSVYEGLVGEAISEYAIPLATAWRALDPKKRGLYDLNLCPVIITEGQKAFKLAWHGWLLALMIIGSIVFLFSSIESRNTEIKRQKETLVRKKKDLADLEQLRLTRSKLQTDIARYANAASVYDSIAPGSDRWSRVLHYLANSVEDLNSLWLYRIVKDDQNPGVLRISGRSIYRTRISRLASLFERATLKQVRTTAIRDKIVYEFDLIVEQVDKGDGAQTKPR